MRPTRVQARDFRSYGDLDLQLPDGPTAIVGGNGAGKSSLLTMIELGLFAGRGELSGCIRNGADSVEVTVEVDHAGERYRVRRGAGKKSYLDFERLAILSPEPYESWAPLTLAAQQDTQELIDTTLGLDRDTYTASAHLGQGKGSFAGAGTTPRQRMALFSGLLGLGIYALLAEAARVEKRSVDAEIFAVRARLADADEQLAGKPALERQAKVLAEMVTEAEQAHKVAENTYETTRIREQQAREQTNAVATARETLRAAEAEHKRLADVTTAGEDARAQMTRSEPELVRLTALVSRIPGLEGIWRELREQDETYKRRLSTHQAAVGAAASMRTQQQDLYRRAAQQITLADTYERKAVQALAEPGTPCVTCKRPLGEEDAQRAAASYREDGAVALAEAERLNSEASAVVIPAVGDAPEPPSSLPLTEAEQNLRAARTAENELAGLRERINGLREKIAQAEDTDYANALAESTKALEAAEDALLLAPGPTSDEIEKIKQDGLAARAQVNIGQQLVDQAREKHTRVVRDLEHLTALAERTAADHEQQTVLEAQADVLAAAEQAHGRTGIPALILENRVGAIEAQATQILADLGGDTAGARIEIRTQREKADGGVQDRLDVVLVTSDGYDRAYEDWSGGEQLRINVALRWALAAGTGVEIVILDEPAALDDEGKTALRDIIDFLLGRGVRTILVVSHEAELRDSFEQVLTVEKHDGCSVILDQAAVPA